MFHVCGPEAVEPALKALAIIERITLDMDQHGEGFGFPVPGMMTKHYVPEGLSAAIKDDHQQYRKALDWMQQVPAESSRGPLVRRLFRGPAPLCSAIPGCRRGVRGNRSGARGSKSLEKESAVESASTRSCCGAGHKGSLPCRAKSRPARNRRNGPNAGRPTGRFNRHGSCSATSLSSGSRIQMCCLRGKWRKR